MNNASNVAADVAVEASVSLAAGDDPTTDIPRDYLELEEKHGEFIDSLLGRYNRVGKEAEELWSHMRLKLIDSDVLGKYRMFVSTKMPRTVTALQAVEMLGINWFQWATAMWAYHKGDPVVKDGITVGRRQGHWMPTPVNEETFLKRSGGKSNGYSAKTAVFDSEDIFVLLAEETMRKDGTARGVFHKQGKLKLPALKASKGGFQSYLAKAVHNHFVNWLRTKSRKHQERVADTFFEFRPRLDEPFSWEANLEDKRGAHQEVVVAAKMAREKLSLSLHESLKEFPSCKPVAEHETEMFELLESGVPLKDTLRKMDLPERVQRAVLRSIQDPTRRPQRAPASPPVSTARLRVVPDLRVAERRIRVGDDLVYVEGEAQPAAVIAAE